MAKQKRLKNDWRTPKTKHYLKPWTLTQYLRRELDNGHFKLTFAEIAFDLFERSMTDSDHEEIVRCWHQSEKQLRRHHAICVMLVTEFYFDNFRRKEPDTPMKIAMSIAGGGRGRKAHGVRLLTAKGARHDPMMIAYQAIGRRSALGKIAAVEDRWTLEWGRGNVSKRVAQREIKRLGKPLKALHQKEFKELMGE
jgi:hypothetical protein